MSAFARLRSRNLAAAALIAFGLSGAAAAQPFGETVAWTVAPPASVKPGDKLTLTVRGAVQKGWHVYGLKQLPNGPTPLKVGLVESPLAAAAGAPAGSAAVKLHDPAFNLETQYYASDFTLTVPVKIAAKAAAGQQALPLSVRYQTCNGEICQPPRTVRLSASVNVQPAR